MTCLCQFYAVFFFANVFLDYYKIENGYGNDKQKSYCFISRKHVLETPCVVEVFPSFYCRELWSFRSVVSSVKNVLVIGGVYFSK